jgi:peptidoglycan/xylan/chitin deacetylase (PgdA/CDA1 family)
MAEFVPAKVPPAHEPRETGMDHAHYSFRSLPAAPRFAWPDGGRIAFTVTLVLDHWELDPPPDESPDPRIVSPLGKFRPDWLTWSHRLYGVRVGIFRILEVLDLFNLTPSVALGTEAARRYPELVDELECRDACFMAHGHFASRRITGRMTNEAEFIASARDQIAELTGQTPTGWCGQDFNESVDTPALLRDSGFHYLTDWANDDRPYLLDGLVALPPQPEWNDLECMWLRRITPPVWSANMIEAFDVLHAEGGAVFNITVHPWIAGQAHRVRYLRDALHGILGKREIWRTTTDALAAEARRQLT